MMNKKIEFVVEYDSTIRDYLMGKISRKLYKRLRNFGLILLNGKERSRHEVVKPNDVITIIYEIEENDNWPEYSVLPNIIYENDDYMIVYKEASLLTIPTKAEPRSLYQSIKYYFTKKNINASISFINRLDKETQGLVLVAKNRMTANYFNSNKEMIDRKYLALCHGHLKVKKDTIINHIAKDGNKRFVSDNGKLAVSEYEVVKEYAKTSLVMFHLKTGRTHQIRVHASYLGNPILGDNLYGFGEDMVMRLCSYYVSFTDPKTDELMNFEIKPEWV